MGRDALGDEEGENASHYADFAEWENWARIGGQTTLVFHLTESVRE
jgi:hypothetical protein